MQLHSVVHIRKVKACKLIDNLLIINVSSPVPSTSTPHTSHASTALRPEDCNTCPRKLPKTSSPNIS